MDARLLESSGGTEVVVLPTAAAYEHPDRAVATATKHFEAIGGTVRGVMALRHADADEPANVEAVRQARFLYLGGGSPLHLRSVLKATALLDALIEAWQGGAVLAGSSAGAMVLGDPMVDPRGGAFTLGLGLVKNLAVLPHASGAIEHRTLRMAPPAVRLLSIPEQTAVVFDADGTVRADGADPDGVVVHLGGQTIDLATQVV